MIPDVQLDDTAKVVVVCGGWWCGVESSNRTGHRQVVAWPAEVPRAALHVLHPTAHMV